MEGLDPAKKTPTTISRPPDPTAPFCGLVFKILAEKHGDLAFRAGLLGHAQGRQPGLESGPGSKKENIAQLWHVQADRREQVPEAKAGDIVGVIGPRASVTGDTLCDAAAPILLETITFPETVISMAIEPETSLERKKLADALEMMKRQDPTFRAMRERGDRPDADLGHGRAASGGDPPSAGAGFQAQVPGPQAAGELQGDARTRRRP